MDNAISPADLAAVMRGNTYNGYGDGCGGSWWILLLFIVLFGGGGFGWGNNAAGYAYGDNNLQRAMDLNAIQSGQANVGDAVQRTAYEVGGIVKDTNLDLTTEIRDVQAALATDTAALQNTVNNGFSLMQTSFCNTQKAIDGLKYEGALNTASINSNIDAKFAAIEKNQLQQQIANQKEELDSLKLQTALCGIPRINTSMYNVYPAYPTYGPFYGGYGYGYGGTSF